MKTIIVLIILAVCGCGFSSRGNESIVQPKKVVHQTPMFCNDRIDVDVSFGVMRNGVGSMSTHDAEITVANQADVETLEKAIAQGRLVNITLDERRFTWCETDEIITHVAILEESHP